ncbi:MULTISPECIES: hypothetical protein [unclassified Streptomyces]|uniref:hypothetical protein n=1 Tax=unclassified Streptomyces TaxID=2593676 RepID=UPI0036593D2A
MLDAATASSARARAFTAAHRARRGNAPAPLYAVEAYDAVHLPARCAEGLGRPRIGRGDLLPTVRTTTYQGVSKTYAFDTANGTFTGEGLSFYEVASGRFRLLGDRWTLRPA